MSTTKTIKIQKNKILTYSINKTGFQTVNKTITVTGDTTITEELVSQTGSPIQALGDRLFGISTFFMYFTPSGEYDKDSLKYITASQTTGTGLTNIQVVKGTSNTEGETQTWLSKVEKELSIVTPKGTSKTFVFTYNGATWDITGDLTLSGQDIEDYGISFTGTPANGDVITVIETQYNKFACYVLDSNYRGNYAWGDTSILIMPKQYASNPQDCIESASYYNNYAFNNANLSNYPIFNFCKNLGNFILLNGIKINALVPNGAELEAIYSNRVVLDSFDPVIQSGGTDYNLTNWAFSGAGVYYPHLVFSCLEYNDRDSWLYTGGSWIVEDYREPAISKGWAFGCIPIFEVPVM